MDLQAIIQKEDIENVLTACVEHAETKAHLYGSLGDYEQHRYWVKVWWSLQCACDRIAINGAEVALAEWERYQRERSQL